MRLIIAGGRDFWDFETLVSVCDELLKDIPKGDIEFVSGAAKGADCLGEDYARIYGLTTPTRFEAKWKIFGRSAGHKRNEKMAKYGDMLIAFWDGKSRGTASMIKLAKHYDLIGFVYGYDGVLVESFAPQIEDEPNKLF